MTIILLIAFVWGMSKVISGFDSFFDWQIDRRWERYHTLFLHGDKKAGFMAFIMKPTLYCNICMSSFWGSVCYWLILNMRDLQLWILHCVISAGAIFIINHIMEALKCKD